MQKKIGEIRDTFEKNIKAVYDLMNFDESIQIFCLARLRKVNAFLEKHKMNDNPLCSVKQILKQVETIRTNESLRSHYQIMLNQCIVLLVSYFASAVEDIFENALSTKLKQGASQKLNKEDLKLTIGELQELDFNLSDNIGELIVAKKQISFQDMQSIARAFNDYLDFEPEKDKHVNNIILAQAARHTLVHSGGVVKDRIIKQLSNAIPRDLKLDISINDQLSFETNEITIIGRSMTTYLDSLIKGTCKKLKL